MRTLSRVFIAGLAATLWAAPPVRAQTTIDDGTFRLVVDGREVGTERFAIQLRGSGPTAETTATGSVTLDSAAGEDVTTTVSFAGLDLRPAQYTISVGGEGGDRLSGRVSGRRVSARIVSTAGENVREYLVSEGAIIIDDAVAHQHYFLARRVRAGETRIPVIVPRDASQAWVDVEILAAETLTVAGTPVECRKLRLTGANGTRILWTDDADRIIRFEIPERSFVAERTAVPR
jgi:hypothetical protein